MTPLSTVGSWAEKNQQAFRAQCWHVGCGLKNKQEWTQQNYF
jgi:hypothetical protein